MSEVSAGEVDCNFHLSYDDKTHAEKFLSILHDVPRCIRFNQTNLWVPFEHRIDPEGQIYSYKQDNDWVPIEIVNIRDVRVGKYARKTPVKVPSTTPTTYIDYFTIIYGPNCVKLTFLDLCSVTKNFAVKRWAHALMAVAYNIYERNICQVQAIKRTYYKFMLSQVENETEVKLSSLQKFWGCSTDIGDVSDKIFPIDAFTLDIYKEQFLAVADFPSIRTIYDSLKEGKHMSLREFSMFLKTVQQETFAADASTNRSSCKFILKEFEKDLDLLKGEKISYESFREYLLSPYNSVLSKESVELHQDMSLPLAKYFIKSSHNTYLNGHQLKGESSVEMYRQVLLTGCRCVELDCYNDGLTEVKITHGKYSLVTDILFRDTVEAIAESAFKTSEYPVILSFENHCSERNQGTMGKYCIEYFKDYLLSAPLETHPLAKDVELPSPNDLKFKILIKNKKSKLNAAGKSEEPVSCDSDVNLISTESSKDKTDSEDLVAAEDTELSEVGCTDRTLSNLINYIEPVAFRSFAETIEKAKYYEMSSFNEDKALGLARVEYQMFIKYNLNNNSRIYPKNTRINSINFVPTDFWAVGCQMVALNYQSVDIGMSLNLAFFQLNGNSGYILKPEHLLEPQTVMNSISNSVQNSTQHTFSVILYFGHFLAERRSRINVEVELFGIPEDSRKHKSQTVVVDSYCVDFKGVEFKFPLITNMDVSHLRFTVNDERQAICLGCRTVPMLVLKPGYRFIELKSEYGQSIAPAALFVQFKRDVYVPENNNGIANFLLNVSMYAPTTTLEDASANPLSNQSSSESPISSMETSRGRSESMFGSNNNAFINFMKNKKSNVSSGCLSDDQASIFEAPKSDDGRDDLNKYFNDNMTPEIIINKIKEEKKFAAKFEVIKSKIADLINQEKKDINKCLSPAPQNSIVKIVKSLSKSRRPSLVVPPNPSQSAKQQTSASLINNVRSFHAVLRLALNDNTEKIMKEFTRAEKMCFETDIRNLEKEHKRLSENVKMSCFDSVKKHEKHHDGFLAEQILNKVFKLADLYDTLTKRRITYHNNIVSKISTVEKSMKDSLNEAVSSSMDKYGTPDGEKELPLEFTEFYNVFQEHFDKVFLIFQRQDFN